MSTCIIYSIVILVLSLNDPSEVKDPASNVRKVQAQAQTIAAAETTTK